MKRVVVLGWALLVVSGLRAADPPAESAEFSGVLQARERAEIRSRITSSVEKIHVEPGAAVKKGDLLFTLDARVQIADLTKAEAELTAATAVVKLKSLEAARAKDLVTKGVLDKLEAEKSATELTLAEAKVKGAQADVQKAKIELEYTRITAPFDGRLDPFGQVVVGNLATSGKTVLTGLSAASPILIDFTLDEATLVRLQKALGNKSIADAKLAVKAGLATDKELSITGTLEAVDNKIDPKSRLLRARASIPNPGSKLVPGQMVKLRIVFPEAKPEK